MPANLTLLILILGTYWPMVQLPITQLLSLFDGLYTPVVVLDTPDGIVIFTE